MQSPAMKPSKRVTAIFEQCRANRDDGGVARISAKDVATLVRERLKVAFEGTKFSVRSDCNSVDVYWTDEPAPALVESITSAYKFGGFDGMIDLAYYADNWLMPDGRMMPAKTDGTEGGRGTVPSFASDCPEPGAIMVKHGPRYVFTHRSETAGHLLGRVRAAADYYGFDFDPQRPLWDQYEARSGDCIVALANRLESDIARERIKAAIDNTN